MRNREETRLMKRGRGRRIGYLFRLVKLSDKKMVTPAKEQERRLPEKRQVVPGSDDRVRFSRAGGSLVGLDLLRNGHLLTLRGCSDDLICGVTAAPLVHDWPEQKSELEMTSF